MRLLTQRTISPGNQYLCGIYSKFIAFTFNYIQYHPLVNSLGIKFNFMTRIFIKHRNERKENPA